MDAAPPLEPTSPGARRRYACSPADSHSSVTQAAAAQSLGRRSWEAAGSAGHKEGGIADRARKHPFRWYLLAGAAAVAAAAVAFRWREIGFEWGEFAAVLGGVHWGWVAAGAAFALSTYLGRALRWQVLIRGVKKDASLWRLTVATAIGFTAIVLFGRAGEMVRPYLIAVKEKVSFSSQVAAWVIERFYDLLTALLIFGIALSRVEGSGIAVGPRLSWILQTGGWLAGLAGLAVLVILALFHRYAEAMEKRLLEALAFLPGERHGKVASIVGAFRHGVVSSQRPGTVVELAFYSLFEWALIIAAYYCLCLAFPPTQNFRLQDVVIFVGFVAFGAVVQIPGVGGGIQVASMLVLTELFGLSLEAAGGLALLIWAVTLVGVVPFGLLLAFHEGINWHKLRRIEEEVRQ